MSERDIVRVDARSLSKVERNDRSMWHLVVRIIREVVDVNVDVNVEQIIPDINSQTLNVPW